MVSIKDKKKYGLTNTAIKIEDLALLKSLAEKRGMLMYAVLSNLIRKAK